MDSSQDIPVKMRFTKNQEKINALREQLDNVIRRFEKSCKDEFNFNISSSRIPKARTSGSNITNNSNRCCSGYTCSVRPCFASCPMVVRKKTCPLCPAPCRLTCPPPRPLFPCGCGGRFRRNDDEDTFKRSLRKSDSNEDEAGGTKKSIEKRERDGKEGKRKKNSGRKSVSDEDEAEDSKKSKKKRGKKEGKYKKNIKKSDSDEAEDSKKSKKKREKEKKEKKEGKHKRDSGRHSDSDEDEEEDSKKSKKKRGKKEGKHKKNIRKSDSDDEKEDFKKSGNNEDKAKASKKSKDKRKREGKRKMQKIKF